MDIRSALELMGSKVFAFGDIAGPVQFGKPAILKKATHPELTERAAFVLASQPCRAYRVIRRSRSRVMPAASMAIARTVTSDMSIPVWASESAADVLPPATTPVFAPGLGVCWAEDELSPDVPPGTVPGLFCSLPPGAVLFGLGCVTIALRAVHQKGRQPLRAWSLYASFSLPVSLMLLCDLLMLPRYMSEAVSVAVFTMLAGAACLIGPGNMSPSASSSPSSAL